MNKLVFKLAMYSGASLKHHSDKLASIEIHNYLTQTLPELALYSLLWVVKPWSNLWVLRAEGYELWVTQNYGLWDAFAHPPS